jgi:hypothetical protein
LTVGHRGLADFENMHQLRMIGLMDATKMFTEDIPSDTPENRVWTFLSDVGNLTSDGTDPFGKIEATSTYLRDTQIKTLFALFGLAPASRKNSRLARFLHEHFAGTLKRQIAIDKLKLDGVPNTLWRTFLRMNQGRAYTEQEMSTASASTSSLLGLLVSDELRSTLSALQADLREMGPVRGFAERQLRRAIPKMLVDRIGRSMHSAGTNTSHTNTRCLQAVSRATSFRRSNTSCSPASGLKKRRRSRLRRRRKRMS